jgi:hypothetical protein
MVIQLNCEARDNNEIAIRKNCDHRGNYAMTGMANSPIFGETSNIQQIMQNSYPSNL